MFTFKAHRHYMTPKRHPCIDRQTTTTVQACSYKESDNNYNSDHTV